MSENSSKISPASSVRWPVFWRVLALVTWVIVGFLLASLLVLAIAQGLTLLDVPLSDLNESVVNTAAAGLVYLLSALIVIGVPQMVRRMMATREDMGIHRLPTWRDIALAPAGFVVYFIASAIVTSVVTGIIPGFDANEAQDVGFADLSQTYEYVLAFLTLVVLAPVAEELLFRGYLYGKLRKWLVVWLAALVASIVFGVVHGQWNVGVDVFVLSLVMCALREVSGGIWAGTLLHMLKNGLAFYLLFVNPTLLNTIGG